MALNMDKGACSSPPKLLTSKYGSTIEVEQSVFVTKVHALQILVDQAQNPAAHNLRKALRVLRDLALSAHMGKTSLVDADVIEFAADFVEVSPTRQMRLLGGYEVQRIILDSFEMGEFGSLPRMNQSVLDTIEHLTPPVPKADRVAQAPKVEKAITV